MIDHDRLFKELLSTFFVEFIELFLPDVMAYLEPDSLTFLDKEVFTDVTAGERYEADLLVQAQWRILLCKSRVLDSSVVVTDFMITFPLHFTRLSSTEPSFTP